MSELKSVLERSRERIGSSRLTPESVYRRRDRKERARRINALVLAMVVVVTGAAVLLRAFNQRGGEVPVSRQITADNVSDLTPLWRADLMVPDAEKPQPVLTPAVADGSVFAVTGWFGGSAHGAHRSTLAAFPVGCSPSHGGSCSPTWIAHVPSALGPPLVADGMVFSVSVSFSPGPSQHSTGRIYAFDETCGSGGSTCSPAWTAPAETCCYFVSPVAAGGYLYVPVVRPGDAGGILVFRTSCGSGGSTCRPVWMAPTPSTVWNVAIAGGQLIVGARHLYAFPLTCPNATCDPLWSLKMAGGVTDVAASGDRLFVGASESAGAPGLKVFSLSDCQARAGDCSPLWVADRTGDVYFSAVSGDQVFAQDITDLYPNGIFAYPVDCRTDGGFCNPTWWFRSSDSHRGFTEAAPAVAGDVVFTGNRGLGNVLAFPTSCQGRCEPIWTSSSGVAMFGGVATDGNVVAAGGKGLTAFGLPPEATTSEQTAQPVAAQPPWALVVALGLAAFAFGGVVLARRRMTTRSMDDAVQ